MLFVEAVCLFPSLLLLSTWILPIEYECEKVPFTNNGQNVDLKTILQNKVSIMLPLLLFSILVHACISLVH